MQGEDVGLRRRLLPVKGGDRQEAEGDERQGICDAAHGGLSLRAKGIWLAGQL
jgi:hypothetical protein